MANNAIKQITIRRGNSQGGIGIDTYDIGGSDGGGGVSAYGYFNTFDASTNTLGIKLRSDFDDFTFEKYKTISVEFHNFTPQSGSYPQRMTLFKSDGTLIADSTYLIVKANYIPNTTRLFTNQDGFKPNSVVNFMCHCREDGNNLAYMYMSNSSISSSPSLDVNGKITQELIDNNGPSYITEILSYNGGETKKIASSIAGYCDTQKDVDVKIIKSNLGLNKIGSDIPNGFTLNVYFDDSNIIFSDNLKLKFENDNRTFPIISAVTQVGNANSDTTFSYPRQNGMEYVTLVFRTLAIQKNGVSIDPYNVQQAIGTQQIPNFGQNGNDFNLYTQNQTVEVPDANTWLNKPSDITQITGGILESIPIRETLVTQRFVTNQGILYQRQRYEDGSQHLPPDVYWSKQQKATMTQLN